MAGRSEAAARRPLIGVVRVAIDGATLFVGLYVLAAVWLTRRRLPLTESNAP